MENNSSKKRIINKVLLIVICVVLSIAFSFGLKTYIDYQGIRINEEEPYGDDGCFIGGYDGCFMCKTGYTLQNGVCVKNGTSETASCLPGKYLDNGICKTCLSDFYCNGIKPFECPNDKTSDSGSDSLSDCYCPVGKYIEAGSNKCKTCPAGQYCPNKNTERTGVTCPAGSYCPSGSSQPSPCPTGKTSNIGAKSKDSCYEATCKIESISTGVKKRSVDDSFIVSVRITGNVCSNYNLKLSTSNGSVKKISESNNNYSFEVTGKNSCREANITATLSNGDSASISVEIVPKWSKQKGYWLKETYDNMAHNSNSADMAGVDKYITDLGQCNLNEQKQCYTSWYSRSCGASNSAPPSTPTESKACYKTSNGEYKWDTKESGYTLVEGIEEEDDCKKPEIVDVSICEEKETIPKKSIKEATCDGNVNFVDDVTKSCSFETSENDFYKITCRENLGVNLNPSTTSSIRLGLGFSYDVSINTKRTCTGEFDADGFKKSYNNVKKNIENATSDADKRTNENKLKDLKEILDNYNKWESNYNLDDITAKLNDNQLNTNINFIKKEEQIEKGNKVKVSDNNLGITGLTNPIDFTYTETLTKTLTLPTAYYNTNKIVYNKCDGCVKLSNQYYISDNRNYINTDYKYTVIISGLGFNQSWSIKTNDCSLKVVEDPIIYRPVEDSDPFLESADSNRQTGRNWKNDLFDFTEIIDEDIWSEKSLYEFNITNQNVKEIKKNNSDLGANAYLGIDCKLITTTNRYYCEFLRNDRYFNYHYIYRDNIH